MCFGIESNVAEVEQEEATSGATPLPKLGQYRFFKAHGNAYIVSADGVFLLSGWDQPTLIVSGDFETFDDLLDDDTTQELHVHEDTDADLSGREHGLIAAIEDDEDAEEPTADNLEANLKQILNFAGITSESDQNAAFVIAASIQKVLGGLISSADASGAFSKELQNTVRDPQVVGAAILDVVANTLTVGANTDIAAQGILKRIAREASRSILGSTPEGKRVIDSFESLRAILSGSTPQGISGF